MKRFLLILILVQIVVSQANAIDSTRIEKKIVEFSYRQFYLLEQQDMYKFIPSNLWLWENGDYSSIFLGGSKDKGDFKTVNDFDQNQKLSFKSESVQSFHESGWRFYGNFTLDISNHDNALWNLGYYNSEVGSPFTLITQRNGDFNVKHYGLNGILNKKLGEKLSIAAGVNYSGDIFSRMNDTRNEFYTLTAEFKGAFTYTLNKHRNISLGVSYFFMKGQPNFSNEFKTDGPEYYLYFNEGLGDFDNIELSATMYLKNQSPKYYIGYFSDKKNKFSAAYSLYIGNEHWDHKITSSITETDQEIYKYEYFDNQLNVSYLVKEKSYELFNNIEANYISGSGYKNRGVFQKTYNYERLSLVGSSELLKPRTNLFYLSKVSVGLETLSKMDMVYAQKIEFTNANAKLRTGYAININTRNKIVVDAEVFYKHNLSYKHSIAAARAKPYTLNLAYNEIAYNSANYFRLGGDVGLLMDMKSSGVELRLSYRFLTPTSVQFSNEYSVIAKSNYRHFLQTSLNIIF